MQIIATRHWPQGARDHLRRINREFDARFGLDLPEEFATEFTGDVGDIEFAAADFDADDQDHGLVGQRATRAADFGDFEAHFQRSLLPAVAAGRAFSGKAVH